MASTNPDTTCAVSPLSSLTSEASAEWQGLANALGANFSLSPEWIQITAKSHGIFENAQLWTVRRHGRLAAVLPLTISKVRSAGISLTALELVANRVSYHNTVLSSLPIPFTLDLLLSLARENSVDFIHFAGIGDDTELAEVLGRAEQKHKAIVHRLSGEASPYLPLNLSWDELVASKPKKFRYKLRKREEMLQSSGNLDMRWYSSPDECPALLRAMEAVEESSWKQQAGVSIFARPHEKRYHELLLPFLGGRGALRANVLFRQDTPIAYNLCCLWDGWMGQLKTSFDQAHAALSPGSLVIDHAIRRACENGAKEFDFLGNRDPHKLAWTKTVREHSDYYVYLNSTLRGRLVGRAKRIRERMRSRAKTPSNAIA